MLNAEQIHAVELLSQGGKTNKQVANIVGVSETTIYNWKNDNEFSESVIVKAQELFRNSLPDVSNTLIKNAKAGDIGALRIYFDHIGLIEKLRSNRQDMSVSFSWNIPIDTSCEVIPPVSIEASGTVCIE